MLLLILNLSAGAILVGVLIASLRARRTQHHDISAAEIHPDLGAGEELLQDVLAENQGRDQGRSRD